MVWWFGNTPHITPHPTKTKPGFDRFHGTDRHSFQTWAGIQTNKEVICTMLLTLLSETISGTQTPSIYLAIYLNVSTHCLCPKLNMFLFQCLIYDPRESSTKIDRLGVFRAWHEYLREEKQTVYIWLAHLIYLQYIHFMHWQHMLYYLGCPKTHRGAACL